MDLNLKNLPENLEQDLERLAPWYQYFRVDENTYIGLYENVKEKWDRTYCTKEDPPELIEAFRSGYEERMIRYTQQFALNNIIHKLFGPDLSSLSAVELACNDGMKAIHLKSLGFGKVSGYEFREDSVERARYLSKLSELDVNFVNYQVSGDVALYGAGIEQHDIVCSYGLIHHLHDHRQHILEIRKAAKRAIVLFTATVKEQHADNVWQEDAGDTFKSVYGTKKVPTQDQVVEYLQEAGCHDVLQLRYHPAMGKTNFMDNAIYAIGLL